MLSLLAPVTHGESSGAAHEAADGERPSGARRPHARRTQGIAVVRIVCRCCCRRRPCWTASPAAARARQDICRILFGSALSVQPTA